MKLAATSVLLMFFCGAGMAQTNSFGFPTQIKHVVVIVQENRTPDNLFQGLTPKCPQNATTCQATSITNSCYDISSCGLSNQQNSNNPVPMALTPITLRGTYDPGHSHQAFINMCDFNLTTGTCKMDGAFNTETATPNGAYAYVQNVAVTNSDGSAGGLLDPYLKFAQNYGWANFMFQTNQGPSYPAHQFLFSGNLCPERQRRCSLKVHGGECVRELRWKCRLPVSRWRYRWQGCSESRRNTIKQQLYLLSSVQSHGPVVPDHKRSFRGGRNFLRSARQCRWPRQHGRSP